MKYEEIEEFVDKNDANEAKMMYSLSEGDLKIDWKMAIMTAIAIGNRKDLEKEIPELAVANPDNHDWNK